jgi:hypothetical protein
VRRITPKRIGQQMKRTALDFSTVKETRANRGRQVALSSLLRLMVLAIACGQRRLRWQESMSMDLLPTVRRRLGLRAAKVSDTTLYECLARTPPRGCREALRGQVKQDLERKAISNDLFARGVCSIDGKKTAHGYGKTAKGPVLQTPLGTEQQAGWLHYVLRACLTSSSARPILDQHEVQNSEGEVTVFPKLWALLLEAYPRLFRYATVDANFLTKDIFALVGQAGKVLLCGLKDNRRALYRLANRLLCAVEPQHVETIRRNGKRITYELRRVPVPESVKAAYAGATAFVLETKKVQQMSTGRLSFEERRFLTTIPWDELSAEQLLHLIRLHWGIEDGANWTCDVILEEDTHFPCRQGYGAGLTSWLVAMAYNVVAVFRARSRTKGSETPSWHQVLDLMHRMCRRHPVVVVTEQLEPAELYV